MGGAGSALSLSPLGAATNPASLSFLNAQYEINLGLFMPDREYSVTGNPSMFPGTFGLTPGTVSSDSKSFLMPSLAGSWKVGDIHTIGLFLLANGGMNTDYPTATFYDQSSPSTGVNLEQMFVGLTYAVRFSENHAVGLTPVFAYQRFAAKGLASFAGFSSDPANLTGNSVATSSGFGGRIGYIGKFGEMISVGASYQTKMAMSEFERYRGLFAEQGDFDVPATWNAGIAVQATNSLTVAADVQQILYGGVPSIANPLNPANFQPLGTDNGAGFGWQDILVFKLGFMYAMEKEWSFMAGYSYAQQPIPDDQVLFNILAPGVVQHHIALGATKSFADASDLTVAVMYAPKVTVSGPNSLEAPGAQTLEIGMSQWQIEIGYAFR
jgi:long-chain fatty acid transport protein